MSTQHLALGTGANASNFSLTDKELIVERAGDKKWPNVRAPLQNVLWAGLQGSHLQVSLLAKKKATSPLSLVHVTGTVSDESKDAANAFTESVMAAAYSGLKPQRRLRVIVNPRSGPGKAAVQFRKKIEPIFRAAKCHIEVTFTTHSKHAIEIAEKLPLHEFDAVVIMSGDGLVYEVFNGFAAHAESAKAFRMPLTSIPTGSGNGLSLNLLGKENVKDISVAALNAIKGHPMNVDLFSVTQGGERTFSFMTQCLGLMANLDLGTEHLRFMGSQRFVYGYLRELITQKSYSYKVYVKVAESDKHKMAEDLQVRRAEAQAAHGTPSSPYHTTPPPSGLPELKYTGPNVTDREGWLVWDQPSTYIYAGKGPFVSVDLMQFPVSHPDDGLIDIVIIDKTTRMERLKAMGGSERGMAFWLDSQHYFKAHAYRVEPQVPEGYLSIDGEKYPHEAFEVEVHQGLGAFLSMHGHYKADFEAPQSAQK